MERGRLLGLSENRRISEFFQTSPWGLFEKSKYPSFSTNSGERRVEKPRNPEGFLRFLPCVLLPLAKNSAISLFSNKP
jgi:hypothetical protein